MITHQNHKFIYNDIASLEFPNGMCINYDYEAASQNNFELISPDGSFRLVIEFFTSTKSAKEHIEEWCYSDNHEIISPPHPITTPTGLTGYIIKFTSGREHYEECTLNLVGNERCNFWLLHKAGKHYDKNLYDRVKSELLESIKLI